MKKLKTVFMGTPEFAIPSMRELYENTELVGVFTQPDRPSGRGHKLTPPVVKVLAQSYGVTVYQPNSLRKELEYEDILSELAPDFIVVAAYGQILSERVLSIPKYSCVNVHASLLPDLRGASPITAAILGGYSETGVTIMKMAKGLDTGDMYTKAAVPITPETNFTNLHNELALKGAKLLKETLPLIASSEITPEPQDDSLSSYAAMVKKDDLKTTPELENADTILKKVRAFSDTPAVKLNFGGKNLKIFKAKLWEGDERELYITSCDGIKITLLEIAPEGKKRMLGVDFKRGLK